jgi:uronate dehydrogenase
MPGAGGSATVLVTGGAGRIAGYLRAGLPARGWKLRLLDVEAIPGEPDALVGDVRDPGVLDTALDGAAAVVHLAGVASPSAPWPEVLEVNIAGTYEVFEAARRAGVARVVFASSNHANGFAPPSAGMRPPDGDRPDSYYGVSKLFGEALGRLYADRYGLQVASLRIGSCFDRPSGVRMLSTWLSPADACRLVDACLSSEQLSYAVVSGVSANTRGWWDLSPGRRLGYHPHDDAEAFASEVAAAEGDGGGSPERQGGEAAWTAERRP